MTNVNIDTAAENSKKYKNRGLDIKAEEPSRISISLVDIDTAPVYRAGLRRHWEEGCARRRHRRRGPGVS